MAQQPFKNQYHSRRVAESHYKACFVCYKPTGTVLVSSDGKADFFFVCDTHLTDSHFAGPEQDPEVEEAKRKKEALQKEIELVEKKWKEKEKYSKKKKNSKSDEDKKEAAAEEGTSAKAESESKSNQLAELEAIANRKPRVFTLNNDIYKIRLAQYRDKLRSKQTAQMLSKPSLFPSVPTHSPDSSKDNSPAPST